MHHHTQLYYVVWRQEVFLLLGIMNGNSKKEVVHFALSLEWRQWKSPGQVLTKPYRQGFENKILVFSFFLPPDLKQCFQDADCCF
jgi:hypothetical protein